MLYEGLKQTHRATHTRANNALAHKHEGLSRFRGNRQTWL